MSTAVMIGLGILAWILLAIPLALFVGRMIRLRDRQSPGGAEPASAEPFRRGEEAGALSQQANHGGKSRDGADR